MELVERGSRASDAGLMRAIEAHLCVGPNAAARPHVSVAYLIIALSESARFADGPQEEELRTVVRLAKTVARLNIQGI